MIGIILCFRSMGMPIRHQCMGQILSDLGVIAMQCLTEWGSSSTGDYRSGGSTHFDNLRPALFEAATTSLIVVSRWSYPATIIEVSKAEKKHSDIQNGLVNGLFGKPWKPQYAVNVLYHATKEPARKQLFTRGKK